jgi:hypothetical protein
MHWFSRKLKNVECMLKKWKDNLEGDYPEMILLVASMFGSSLVVKIRRASFLLEKKSNSCMYDELHI